MQTGIAVLGLMVLGVGCGAASIKVMIGGALIFATGVVMGTKEK